MISKLATIVTGEQIIVWLIIALLVFYFCYKEWPEFKRRLTSGTKKEADAEQQGKQMNERLSAIERRLASMDEKMQRDYDRLNRLEVELKKDRRADQDSLEEREIIMRTLLGITEGLIEMGVDGPTKAAQTEIKDYLNRKAHRSDVE